jgi:signal transduction histidine kinase
MVFTIGLLSLIFLHLFFQKLVNGLSQKSENLKSKIYIGRYIVTDLYKIRSDFYELATTATNERGRELIKKRISKRTDEIKQSLHILKNGGTFQRVIRLNIAGQSFTTETITYKKYENSISLESIDLLPKLIKFEKMIEDMITLLKKQDIYKEQNNISKYLDLNNEIKSYYKRTPSFFIRITENANRLLYEGSKELESLQKELKKQEDYYVKLEIILVLTIFTLVFIIAFAIALQINKNTKNLERQSKSNRGVLDAQKNIVIVSNGEKMIDANKSLVDFFKNYNSFNEFKSKHLCICDFFQDINKENYLLNKDYDGLKWFEYIINNPKLPHKVAMRRDEASSISHFSISAVKKILDENTFIIIVVLTDITEEVKNQEELKLLNENLEDLVTQKTKELQELNENLEEKIEKEVEDNRKKDKTLIQQSRYAALGEMIGNIAHQWRQPLSAISSTVTSMQLQRELNLATNDDIDKSYSSILRNISFLNQTIEDFRGFFRQDKKAIEFNILEIYRNSMTIINATYKNNAILIIDDVKESRYNALGFPNELTQVFLNILNNAKDILIEKKETQRLVKIHISQTLNYNIIEITDNGGGVEKEIKDKIFDPYFTTKHKSQGTGIGLYMCKEIIEKNLKGSLSIENRSFDYQNEKQYGACFIIKLPKY